MRGVETSPIFWPSVTYPGVSRLFVPESHALAEMAPLAGLQRQFEPSSGPYYDSRKEWQSMEYGIATGDKAMVEESCEQLGKSSPMGPGNLAKVFQEAFAARAMKESISYNNMTSMQTKLRDMVNYTAEIAEADEIGRTRSLRASLILMILSPSLPLPASRRERTNPFSTSYNHTFYLLQKGGKIPIRTRYVQAFSRNEIAPRNVVGVSLGRLADLVLRNTTPQTRHFYGDAGFRQLPNLERRRQALSLVSELVVRNINGKPLDSTEQRMLRMCRARFSQKVERLLGSAKE